MNLDEYIFHKRKKDPQYSNKKFAQYLGIGAGYLSRIINEELTPSPLVAYLIEEYTNGEVNGWHLLTKKFKKGKNEN